jgi:hypothetical protein
MELGKVIHHHITVNGVPWCKWLGSPVGRDIGEQSGVSRCGQPNLESAEGGIERLKAFFLPTTKLEAVSGICPEVMYITD